MRNKHPVDRKELLTVLMNQTADLSAATILKLWKEPAFLEARVACEPIQITYTSEVNHGGSNDRRLEIWKTSSCCCFLSRSIILMPVVAIKKDYSSHFAAL